jgi:hypothetical protein
MLLRAADWFTITFRVRGGVDAPDEKPEFQHDVTSGPGAALSIEQ